jgi:hypothetical protein
MKPVDRDCLKEGTFNVMRSAQVGLLRRRKTLISIST